MISRRQFLVGTAAAVSVAGATAYLARPYLRRLLQPELDTTYSLGHLNDEEAHTIAALGEVLASPRSVPPAGFFRDYVDFIAQSKPGFLKEYQRAAALLNRTALDLFGRKPERRFAALALAERNKVLEELLWEYSGHDSIRPKLEKLTAGQDALALRNFVVQPLLDFYYRSPYGWAVVGYETYPGIPPSDSRAYTRPPSATGART